MALEVEPDPRHEAIVKLHEAICDLESGDAQAASNCCKCAADWIAEIP